MGETAATIVIEASLTAVWDFYFDPATWPAWVDGFASAGASDGYPEAGGTLSWRSRPAGRGTVSERVLEHEPRSLHRIAYSDPESEGEQATRFEIEPSTDQRVRTRVTIETTYGLRAGGAFSAVVDRLFVRSQVRSSLERTLSRLKLEVEAGG